MRNMLRRGVAGLLSLEMSMTLATYDRTDGHCRYRCDHSKIQARSSLTLFRYYRQNGG